MALKYDTLVSDPDMVMSYFYRFLGFPYPGKHIVADVLARRVVGRKDEVFEPGIEKICTSLHLRFEPHFSLEKAIHEPR